MNDQPKAPLTPSYDAQPIPARAPEASALPSSAHQPEQPTENSSVHHPQQKPKAKRRPKPRHKNSQPKKPVTEAERIAALQFRRDSKVLDLQLRVRTLSDFVRQHDLWEVFRQQTAWW